MSKKLTAAVLVRFLLIFYLCFVSLFLLVRHASGTYDVKTRTGGSTGATMRYAPESE